MKIIKAKKRGFCFGVKRAIDIAGVALKSRKVDIYCIGPIIHNPQVVSSLKENGLKVTESVKGLSNCQVILPSHGVSPDIEMKLKKNNIKTINATCPYVLSSQKITMNLVKEGYEVLIFGDKFHPEIKGLLGIAKNAIVVNSPQELKRIKLKNSRIGLVAQTTKTRIDYSKIIEELSKVDFKELKIFNTICTDTQIRQECVRELAKEADIIIVIGGKNSANTRHLVDIAKSEKVRAYHIESPLEIKRSWFKNTDVVGIASGASTPEYLIEEAIKIIKK